MPPGTKPPSSHQTRPPLASRIRASFELKRSRSKGHSRSGSRSEEHTGLIADSTGGSNGSPVITDGLLSNPGRQDTENLRIAIDQAIASDAFQTAIAAHLAKLIKPSIKSALDTIQPLVEAVYTHELLLQKTNQNGEDALERMEMSTNASHRVSRVTLDREEELTEQARQDEAVTIREVTVGGGPDLALFRQQLEEHNTQVMSAIGGLTVAMEANTAKICGVAEGVLELKSNLGPNLESLKTITEEATTTISILQAQQDQLKLDISQILERIGLDIGKNVQAIHERSIAEPDTSLLAKQTDVLDAISTDLTVLKGHSDTAGKLDAISAELAVLKGGVEGGIVSNSEGFTSLAAQITSVVSVIGGHTTLLDDIKESPPHPDLLAAVQQSNDSHALHTTALGDLKERSISAAPIPEGEALPDNIVVLSELKSEFARLKTSVETGLQSHGDNITGLDAKIDSIVVTIGSMKESNSDAEILAAVQQSNVSHASHTTALEGIKGVGGEDSQLGPQIITIISTLEAHTTALEEIKASSEIHTAALEGHGTALEYIKTISSESVPVPSDSNAILETHIASMVSTLEAHTAALDELKGASAVHSSALETHGASLDGIKSINSISEPASRAVDLIPLETQIIAVASTLEAHSTALDEIKTAGVSHTTALEGHGSALEIIKSLGGGDATVSDSPTFAGLETQISSVLETLQAHTSLLDELKDTASTHVAALVEQSRAESAESGSTSDLDIKLGSLANKLETHSLLLDEIKTTGGTHSTVLDEIKTAHTTHASALEDINSRTLEHSTILEEIRSPGLPPMASMGMLMPETLNLAALDIQIGSIVTTLSTHTSALADIGYKVGATNASTLSSDSEKPSLGDLNTVIEILDAHTAVLNEIKEDVSAELLTAIHAVDQKQQNCENLLVEVREGDISEELLTLMHGIGETANGHAAGLKNFYEAMHSSRGEPDATKSIGATPAESANLAQVDLSSLETQIAALHTVLGEHRETLASIKESTIASRDLHIAHGSSLDEMKSRSLEPAVISDAVLPGFAGIETKLENLVAALDEHKTTLSAIQDTTAATHDLHLIHGTSLDEIKSRSLEPAAAPAEMPSFEVLEAKLDSLISSLEEHKTTLSVVKDTATASHERLTSHATVLGELKSRSAEPAPAPEIPSFEGLEGKIDNIISCLEEHKATLSTVNDTTTASHELHATHTTSLDELKSRFVEMPDLSGLDTQLSGIVASLEEHRTVLFTLQDSHSTHTTLLDEIKSKSVNPASIAEVPEISSITPQLGAIVASLEEHKTILTAMQDSHSAHTTSLDEIKSKPVDPAPVAEVPDLSGIDTQLVAIVASLEEHKAMLSAMQDLHDTHTASLDEIKSRSVDSNSPSETANNSGVEAQISSVIASLNEHKMILSSIQEVNGAHVASLAEIKDEGIGSDHIVGISTSLEEQKSSLSALQEKIVALHDFHVEHASSLDEIKSRSVDNSDAQPAVNIEGLEAQISGIVTSLNEQKAVLSELKDTHITIAETHAAAQTNMLNEIKDGTTRSNESHASHAVILGELKAIPVPSSPDLSAVEAHLTTILTTIETQTETLSLLKDGSANNDFHEAVKQSHELITTNHELLTSHTALLSEIKESSSYDEVKYSLAEIKSDIESHGELVKDLHSSTKHSHSNLSTAVGALALGGIAGAGTVAMLSDHESSTDVLAEVKAVRIIVEGSKDDILSMRSQLESGLATITTSLSSMGEEIKTEVGASGTKLEEAITALHGDVRAIDLNSLHSALEQHGSAVKGLMTHLENVDGNVKAIDLASVHTALEQHGTYVKELMTQLESIDGTVKAVNLAPIHVALEQHGTDVKGIATQLEGIDGIVKAIDLSPIHVAIEKYGSTPAQSDSVDMAPLHAALESHGAVIDGINSKIEILDGSLKETTSQIQVLHKGVHLNDAGVQQLQSHVVARQAAVATLSEDSWFSRKKSSSPVLERNDLEDDGHSSVSAVLVGVVVGGALVGGAPAILSSDEDDHLDQTSLAPADGKENKSFIPEDESDMKEVEPEALETDLLPTIEEESQPSAADSTNEALAASEDVTQDGSDSKEEGDKEPDSDPLPVPEEIEVTTETMSEEIFENTVEQEATEKKIEDLPAESSIVKCDLASAGSGSDEKVALKPESQAESLDEEEASIKDLDVPVVEQQPESYDNNIVETKPIIEETKNIQIEDEGAQPVDTIESPEPVIMQPSEDSEESGDLPLDFADSQPDDASGKSTEEIGEAPSAEDAKFETSENIVDIPEPDLDKDEQESDTLASEDLQVTPNDEVLAQTFAKDLEPEDDLRRNIGVSDKVPEEIANVDIDSATTQDNIAENFECSNGTSNETIESIEESLGEPNSRATVPAAEIGASREISHEEQAVESPDVPENQDLMEPETLGEDDNLESANEKIPVKSVEVDGESDLPKEASVLEESSVLDDPSIPHNASVPEDANVRDEPNLSDKPIVLGSFNVPDHLDVPVDLDHQKDVDSASVDHPSEVVQSNTESIPDLGDTLLDNDSGTPRSIHMDTGSVGSLEDNTNDQEHQERSSPPPASPEQDDVQSQDSEERDLDNTDKAPNFGERFDSQQDMRNSRSIEEEQHEDSDFDTDMKSPVLENHAHGRQMADAEDPFTDTPASDLLPPHTQVQSLSSQSPISSSHTSEHHRIEQCLREIAPSQPGNPYEITSSEVENQEPPSSSFIERSYNADYSSRDYVNTPTRNPFALGNTQTSLPVYEPLTPYNLLRQGSDFHPVAVDEQEVESEFESRAASPLAHLQQYSQHTAVGYGAEADYEQPPNSSRPSTSSSGSAFDSFPPRAPFPEEQSSHGQLSRHNAYQYEPEPRDLDGSYGGFGQQSPEIAPSNLMERQTGIYSQEAVFPKAEDYQRQSSYGIDHQVRNTSQEYNSEHSYHSEYPSPEAQHAAFPIAEYYQGQSSHDVDHQAQIASQEYGLERSYHAETPGFRAQQPSNLPARETGEYPRRSTMDDHTVGAGHYAPSATESHYSVSEHPDAAIEADPFAPMYSPTDVVNDYANTPSVYGQTPVADTADYFATTVGVEQSAHRRFDFDEEEIPPVFKAETRASQLETQVQDQYAAQRNISPFATRPPPTLTQNSGYLSHVDQQYMQQDTQRSEFEIPVPSSQHARYRIETSPKELNPYERPIEGELSAPLFSGHSGETPNRLARNSIQDQYASSPETEYIEPRDEPYMQEQTQEAHRPSPIMTAYDSRYGHVEEEEEEEEEVNVSTQRIRRTMPIMPDYEHRYGREEEEYEDEEQDSPLDTTSFQPSHVSRNPFVAPTAQLSVSTMPNYEPRYGREDDMEEEEEEDSTAATTSSQLQYGSRNPYAAPSAPPQFPTLTPGRRNEGSLVSPARNEWDNNEHPSDAEIVQQRYMPQELPQRGHESSTQYPDNAASMQQRYQPQELPPRDHQLALESPRSHDQFLGDDEEMYIPRELPSNGYGGFAEPVSSSYGGFEDGYSRPSLSQQRRRYLEDEEKEEEDSEDELSAPPRRQNDQSGFRDR